MQMFRVLEFLRIRDSKNTLLWKQVWRFSHRNYFQCLTLFLSAALQCRHLKCEKRLWKLKWGKCVNIWAKWGHIIRAYSSVLQNENLEMQLFKTFTTRNYRTVSTQGLWSYLHMYTQQCACIPFYVSVSLFFCKCWLYTSLLVKIWLHWTVNISESVSMHVWIWHPLCRCCDSLYME